MISTMRDILSIMPVNAWYLLIVGGFVLFVVIGCVPEAGERIALFLQRMIELWNTRGRERRHPQNEQRRRHGKRSR